MLNFTPILRGYLTSRLKQHARYIEHADSVQQEQFMRLKERAALTWFGRKYDFSTIRTYKEFATRVPLYPLPCPIVRPILLIFSPMQLRQWAGVSLTQILPG